MSMSMKDQFIHNRRTKNGRKRVMKIKHYSSKHSILLVGEGDFSFATCLAKAFGSATNMVATSLDTQEKMVVKHPQAMENVELLKERGCTVLHGVSAHYMDLHPDLSIKLFDRIVFNFPHAGFNGLEEASQLQIKLHKRLVRRFFMSAREMLKSGGEVHVTHKTAEPYCRWEIEELAKEAELQLVEEVSFSLEDYPGYHNKRGDGPESNASFPVGQASTFKFKHRC